MKDEAKKLKADIFFVAYVQTTEPPKRPENAGLFWEPTVNFPDPATRPITFVFNGGPGAAAVWLHMGTAGPVRIDVPENGDGPTPPYKTVTNESTWLDRTDLVFIDPANTGFSRPAQGEDPKQFFGLEEDAKWMAEFIRLYLTRYERWSSPKFLAGESYGTTRAAKLSQVLLDANGITLNGIVLISTVLNFQTIALGNGNDLPYPLFLPTYTALAFHHKKLPAELQADEAKALKEAETFALGDYGAALAKGDTLPPGDRAEIIKKLVRLTALPADLIEQADLRIDPELFRKSLLADTRQLIGRFDGRLVGVDLDPLAREPRFDPSFSPYFAAYSATFNDYVRRQLAFKSDLDYEVLSGRVHPWNFGGGGFKGYPSVTDELRSAMAQNPSLRVLCASGTADLATPYFATVYTMNHLALPPELRKNIDMTFYPAGHMMYHQKRSLEQLHADVGKFIVGAIRRP